MLNKSVARIVTRLQGDGDGLIIGSLLVEKGLIGDSVYDVQECFLTGDLILRRIGDSYIGSGVSGLNWAFEQQTLLDRLGSNFFLTKSEYCVVLDGAKIDANLS